MQVEYHFPTAIKSFHLIVTADPQAREGWELSGDFELVRNKNEVFVHRKEDKKNKALF